MTTNSEGHTEGLRRPVGTYLLCTPEGVSGGSQAQMQNFVSDAKADIAHLARENARLRGLLWYAWYEFNAIRARSGAPLNHQGMTLCDSDWWSRMTDAFEDAIGPEASTPWPTPEASTPSPQEPQMPVDKAEIEGLVERLRQCRKPDNALDIAIDIALFEPDRDHVSVRANNAGTKLVYTRPDGRTDTFLARDLSLNERRRNAAIALLTALGAQSK